ncbi:MAG: 4,5-DOPA dioxygenase extradiol [Prolixibacteraceae bacterium]|nr:4,5-DOPA dioxygenase extradiol [Prolixibacteraceae bacterium]
MKRKDFITTLITTTTMASIQPLRVLGSLPQQPGKPMPVLFIGHGSPMNGIESNEFSQQWSKLGSELPTPAAVLCISAHWLTRGTYVTAMKAPRTIHDFGGFPQELSQVEYPAPGNPELAKSTVDLVKMTSVGLNHDWGLDHGTWTVVRHMYPDANIPVLQLSIDYHQAPAYHYQLGKELAELRKRGVLIIGSGNMVHNLRMVAWDKLNETEYGYDWANEMNEVFKQHILSATHDPLIDYKKLGEAALKAIPTPDHYYPLLYILGLQHNKDNIALFNDKAIGGSLTMTSVRIG